MNGVTFVENNENLFIFFPHTHTHTHKHTDSITQTLPLLLSFPSIISLPVFSSSHQHSVPAGSHPQFPSGGEFSAGFHRDQVAEPRGKETKESAGVLPVSGEWWKPVCWKNSCFGNSCSTSRGRGPIERLINFEAALCRDRGFAAHQQGAAAVSRTMKVEEKWSGTLVCDERGWIK